MGVSLFPLVPFELAERYSVEFSERGGWNIIGYWPTYREARHAMAAWAQRYGSDRSFRIVNKCAGKVVLKWSSVDLRKGRKKITF